ncbi:diguanylate cyclase [Filobacillus milosensis]|uniref:Diguanylate cyclase n=1 Tax=Filobacillus milosensis TaxID=94137 RepID=A0A4Y8IUW1_9BACI|nr:diguanylate cyclase [Filobacillus milosensis]TFB22888.1 diguanylate cyclase [Filobacillus milosensis]
MRIKKWLVLILVLVVFSLVWYWLNQKNSVPNSEGLFALQEANLNEEVYVLNGEWEFYPNQLLSPQGLRSKSMEQQLVEVPHAFSDYKYATYHSTLSLSQEQLLNLYSIYIPNLGSAYKLWVNGDLYLEEGQMGTNRQYTIPSNQSKIVDLYAEEKEVSVTIQMVNFHHRVMGLLDEVMIGPNEKVSRIQKLRVGFSFLIIGSLSVLMMYYLLSYFIQGRNRYHLFFCLLALIVMTRLSLEGEKFFFEVFPDFPWVWAIKMEYWSFLWLAPLFSILISYMFPKQSYQKFIRFYIILTLGCSLFILLTPTYIFTNYLMVFQSTLVFGFVYILLVIIKAWKNHEKYAFLNLLGFIIVLLTAINDALFYNGWINAEPILSVGFLTYLFVQAMILAIQHAQTEENLKHSTNQLMILNEQLEEKVKERTDELVMSQRELIEKNKFLQKISYLDELTQIPNRRSFMNVLDKDIEEARVNDESVAIMLMDLDRFKNINDRYGHQMGDACLKVFAERLNQHFTNHNGFIARYGGEEFVAILRDKDQEDVRVLAEELRESIPKLKFPGVEESLSVSIGVCYDAEASIPGDVLLKHADEALYKAKDQGRNRVRFKHSA